MKLFGFTYIRNGDTLGYPYHEAFNCLSELCEHSYVAVGDSSDNTREKVASLPRVTIIDTKWEEALRTSGKIFSQQANTALAALRKDQKSGWALHLQADQIVRRDDFEKVREDFRKAEAEGCDGFTMRFLHFWQTPRQIAHSPRWFPQTINAVKVDSEGESVGDSQSLGRCKKIFHSDVTVFHYGHALGEKFTEKKQRALHRWWHPDQAIDSVMKKGQKSDRKEPSIAYLGSHPVWMKDRIGAPLTTVDQCWIVGKMPDFDLKSFLPRIGAKDVKLVAGLSEVPSDQRKKAVLLQPSWWERFLNPSRVPEGMLWANARPWPKDQWLVMKLSEKGIPSDLNGG